MLTRALVWVALALFVFVLLTRLRTLAIVAGTRRGLRETAAIRIRSSRIAVETLVAVAVLSLWVRSTWDRGHVDWNVGDSGLRLQLAGTWLILGAAALFVAMTGLLLVTGWVAFARADDLRERFPRSAGRQPHVLRLAVMSPGAIFIAARRSPLVWMWTEIRAASFGILTTLGTELVGHRSPAVGSALSAVVEDATDELDLEARLDASGGALTWDDLLALLTAIAGAAPAEPRHPPLPPAAPLGARTLGFWFAVAGATLRARRTTRRAAALASFDERASVRAILERTPGPMASVYLKKGVDVLLHEARGGVFDSLKPQLPGRHRRRLTKAYRRDGMEGAAAWMIEQVASYPDLLHRSVRAELDRQADQIDLIAAAIQRRRADAR
jgi:hypothetical protein